LDQIRLALYIDPKIPVTLSVSATPENVTLLSYTMSNGIVSQPPASTLRLKPGLPFILTHFDRWEFQSIVIVHERIQQHSIQQDDVLITRSRQHQSPDPASQNDTAKMQKVLTLSLTGKNPIPELPIPATDSPSKHPQTLSPK